MGQIRAARTDDREAMSEVHVAAVLGVDAVAYDEDELAAWKAGAAAVDYAIEDPETVVLVATDDSDVAGFAEAPVADPELDKLYVDPAYQGQGIARSLSDDIDQRLRARGAESVSVEASLNAATFYERVGYTRVGTHQKEVSAGEFDVQMAVVDMEKRLR